MSVQKIKVQHHVNGQIDAHASELLTLLAQSKQLGLVVPLQDGDDGVRGTSDYYAATASEIVAYAMDNPERCGRFLANMFLPAAEKMNLQRQRALAKM